MNKRLSLQGTDRNHIFTRDIINLKLFTFCRDQESSVVRNIGRYLTKKACRAKPHNLLKEDGNTDHDVTERAKKVKKSQIGERYS